METKLSRLKSAAAKGDWTAALSIAAKFPQLGEHGPRIVRAHEAGHNPRFYRQIGKDPDALVADGIRALQERYQIPSA